MEQIKIEDLNDISSPALLRYSPDKKTLAFQVIRPDKKENGYKKNLWLKKEGEEAKQLTFSGKDEDYIWEDNHTLLFVSGRAEEEKDAEEKTVFYRLNIGGGEAYKAFEIDRTVQFFKKISDGVYCMGIREDRNAPEIREDNKEQRKEEKDYHVIDEVPLWGNGRGFISGIRTGLYLYTESDGKLEKISPEQMDVSSAEVSGQKLLYVGKQWKDVIDLTDSLLLYDGESGENQILIAQGKLQISNAVFAGGRILLTATDMKNYGSGQYHDVYLYDSESAEAVKTAEAGCAFGSGPMTDCCYGFGDKFVSDGGVVYAVGQRGCRCSIFALENGKMKECMQWNGLISCIAKAEDRLAFAAMEANGCCEVYEWKQGSTERATRLNDAFLAEHFVSEAKYIPFVNEAGISIDGWVLEPKDYDPEKTYPGVLEIHGGPRCTYGEVFFHEMQVWASKGWFVFYCNPRGSEGYGEEFADLRGKYGTIDYEDLMAFTDHVLELYPQIDRKRLGAAGGSYGGFMCNWIEGHTDRFAAIASQRSVSNWISDFGCSEIGVTFDQNEIQATPWNGMEKMWDCSPLKYACNAKTPILFIHSMCDYNCTLDQGIQMFTAVKFFGVPARMCLFEGENHSLSRSGKPLHRMRRLKEMTDWFIVYLTGDQKGNN